MSYEPTRQRCIVRYQIATYSGEEVVYCNSDEETEAIIARCKRQLERKSGLPLPFGSQSFSIEEREDYFGE